MSDYDPNSEPMPPGPPLPLDESPDEMRFDTESPEKRPDVTLLEPSVIIDAADQPEQLADEALVGWHAPAPVQFSSEAANSPIEFAPLPESYSAYREPPVAPLEADQAAAPEVPAPHFGELTLPEDWRMRRASIHRRELTERIQNLTAQIDRYPHTPVNFVVRGEVYLANGQAEAAKGDFQRALDLAEGRVDELPWGYVNAGLIDRAREGLNEAQDQLESESAIYLPPA